MKKKKNIIIFQIIAVVLLLALGAVMMVIGRGHTVYFDNKAFEYEGNTYSCPYKVTCYKDGEEFAKLMKRERGMVDVMGQKLKVTLEIIPEKGADPIVKVVTFPIPYSNDCVVINLPAYIAKLPLDVFMTEFIPVEVTEETEETGPVDEFGLSDMDGMDGLEGMDG